MRAFTDTEDNNRRQRPQPQPGVPPEVIAISNDEPPAVSGTLGLPLARPPYGAPDEVLLTCTR